MMSSSCEKPNACDCGDCEYERLIKGKKMKDQFGNIMRRVEDDDARYKPTLECPHWHEQPNIIPQEGDYMVATLQHFNSIKKAGYKLNGHTVPHDRMGVMYLGKHGLSQCSWGSPAVTNGRPIHSDWPGQWKLGLTPTDIQPENTEPPKKSFCSVKD